VWRGSVPAPKFSRKRKREMVIFEQSLTLRVLRLLGSLLKLEVR
jgi:hypothetical protein